MMMQRLLVSLFTFVWWNRLIEEGVFRYYCDKATLIASSDTYKERRWEHRRHVVKVTGWNSAIIAYGCTQRAGIIFHLFEICLRDRIEKLEEGK